MLNVLLLGLAVVLDTSESHSTVDTAIAACSDSLRSPAVLSSYLRRFLPDQAPPAETSNAPGQEETLCRKARFTISFTILPDGRVTHAVLESGSTGDAGRDDSLLHAAARWRFPAAKTEKCTVGVQKRMGTDWGLTLEDWPPK